MKDITNKAVDAMITSEHENSSITLSAIAQSLPLSFQSSHEGKQVPLFEKNPSAQVNVESLGDVVGVPIYTVEYIHYDIPVYLKCITKSHMHADTSC